MPAPENQPGPRRGRGVFIAVIVTVVVVAFILVHLTGVIGAGSH